MCDLQPRRHDVGRVLILLRLKKGLNADESNADRKCGRRLSVLLALLDGLQDMILHLSKMLAHFGLQSLQESGVP